jgi:LacI family transcriptional regulator
MLRRDHPEVDGVLCFNDLTALGVMTGCARLGLAVGDDLRVVGCDDIEECALAWPRLSSIGCDIATFGRRTAETLLRWLEEDDHPPAETRAPVRLMIRASSRGSAA